jgi:hypothetical protein
MSGKRKLVNWIVAYLIPRWLWLTWHRLRHPVHTYYIWKKERAFPVVGEKITYHDEPHTVIGVKEHRLDVQIDTGEWVSWMHCCGSLR